MWQIHALMALDIARERAREAQQQALADQAIALRRAEMRAHRLVQPSRARLAAARSLRAASGAFAAASHAACEAATKLDRRTV
jgi:hypothetical protein